MQIGCKISKFGKNRKMMLDLRSTMPICCKILKCLSLNFEKLKNDPGSWIGHTTYIKTCLISQFGKLE